VGLWKYLWSFCAIKLWGYDGLCVKPAIVCDYCDTPIWIALTHSCLTKHPLKRTTVQGTDGISLPSPKTFKLLFFTTDPKDRTYTWNKHPRLLYNGGLWTTRRTKILHGKGTARKTITMSSPKSPYIASLDQEDELFVVLRGAVMIKCL
jgi:hypothetical protein